MVDPWHILSAGCVCGIGALSFLKLVANELSGLSSELDAFRQREQAQGAAKKVEAQKETDVVESTVEKLV